jgi:hypothetical protein
MAVVIGARLGAVVVVVVAAGRVRVGVEVVGADFVGAADVGEVEAVGAVGRGHQRCAAGFADRVCAGAVAAESDPASRALDRCGRPKAACALNAAPESESETAPMIRARVPLRFFGVFGVFGVFGLA